MIEFGLKDAKLNQTGKEHWDSIYQNYPLSQLGWYEEIPTPSLELIEHCGIPKQMGIVDVGSGASTLIPQLLAQGYQSIHAVDISRVALDQAKARLGSLSDQVNWINEDILHSEATLGLKNIAIWHDRAVFHFLCTEEQRRTYLSRLQKVLMPGGFLIVATFALDAPAECSGLPVQRYNIQNLMEFFGDGFKLIETLEVLYHMPSGDERPFVYACFQKISS